MNIPKIALKKELPQGLKPEAAGKWIETDRNSCLMGKGFYVSFAENWEGNPETAIVDEETMTLRSLEGDWRKDYESLVPDGIGRCIEFYETKRSEFDSAFSTECERTDRWEKRYKSLVWHITQTQTRMNEAMKKNPRAMQKLAKDIRKNLSE